MSLKSMLTKPVTVVYARESGKDEYGQPVYRETSVNTTCYYRLQQTVVGDAVYQVEEQVKVYFAPDLDANHIKAVVLGGTRWEPAGAPHLQWNPRSASDQYLMLSVRKAKS